MPDAAPSLAELGWDDRLTALFAPYADAGLRPARVTRGGRGAVDVLSVAGAARVRFGPDLGDDLPVVGDWVALADGADGADRADGLATVVAVVPRGSALVRGATGPTTGPQVLAANVDRVLILVGLDNEPNQRRLERALAIAWSSGALPAVVLTKADLCADRDAARLRVEEVALGVDVVLVSAVTGEGVDGLRSLVAGRTSVLVGASGAGKSTLANVLCGNEELATAEVRSDGKGRHTTVAGELVVLPGGGVLLDTPGLRAIALWDAGDGLERTFADVEEAAAACRFSDCAHDREPGCAVRESVPPARLEAWRKLQGELRHLARRQDQRLAAEDRRAWKLITREHRGRGRP